MQKICFVVIMLERVNFLNLRIGTIYLFWNLISILKLPALYMHLSAAVAIRNILDKPDDILKRDWLSTESTFDNLNMKRHLRTCAKGIFKIFPFFKMKENSNNLGEGYEEHFIKKV